VLTRQGISPFFRERGLVRIVFMMMNDVYDPHGWYDGYRHLTVLA
jgi:hypothetical protein